MNKVQRWLTALLIILWPSNLFLKFAVESGYLHGLMVDYLLPKLYLSDVVIVALFVCWLIEWWMGERRKKSATKAAQNSLAPRKIFAVGAVIALISFILQFSVGKPLAAFWFLEKIVEMVLLTAFLATHRQFFKDKLMIAALMVMVTMQSVIGLGQFIKQSSFFPSYTWLGESRLEHRAGLARGSFENMERVLPYGTTSHPNVLGAVLAIGLLALWTGVRSSSEHTRTRNTIYTGAASILPLITLYLTQSWSAWLALAGGVGAIWLHAMLLKHKHSELWGKAILAGVLTTAVVTPFLLHELAQTFPNNTSFTRRDSLNQIAFRIWQQKPIFGVGLNQFSAEIENTTPTGEVVRFIQPAHHVGLLILAEMGIAGAVFAVAFLHALYAPLSGTQRKKLWATLPCIAVIFLPMAVLDHFLWTQQIGQLALMIGGVWITTHFSLVKK